MRVIKGPIGGWVLGRMGEDLKKNIQKRCDKNILNVFFNALNAYEL